MHNLKMRKMRIGSCLKESFARMGLTEACTFVHDDAKFVNEMTQNDLVLLSLGVMRSDTRAYQDIAILESEFLEFDARVREDIEKIDHGVRKKAKCLHHIAIIMKDKAVYIEKCS